MLLEMEGNKKKLVENLTRGRNSAKKLLDLVRKKVHSDGLVSVDDLVTEISESFYGSLLVLNSSNSSNVSRVPESPRPPKVSPGPDMKGRRGCYKRRKTVDSRIEISGTIKDGYEWRKYGQKEILNSKFPRCYFRCTHKHDLGCKALKQVQKMEDESNMFHITYFGYHTCFSTPNFISHRRGVVDDCEDFMIHHNLPSSPSTNNTSDPSLKQKDHCDNNVSSANGALSSSAFVWNDILIYDFESYKNNEVNVSLS